MPIRLSKYPCIFVQIPKSGCASINSVLQQTGGHRKASQIRQEIEEKDWNERFKFALVRHPYDRFISVRSFFNYKNDVQSFVKQLDGEVEFLNKLMWRTQSDFLDEDLDYIGSFSKIEEEWDFISRKIGANVPLPHENKTKREKLPLSDKDKALLYEYYKEDFDRFEFQP